MGQVHRSPIVLDGTNEPVGLIHIDSNVIGGPLEGMAIVPDIQFDYQDKASGEIKPVHVTGWRIVPRTKVDTRPIREIRASARLKVQHQEALDTVRGLSMASKLKRLTDWLKQEKWLKDPRQFAKIMMDQYSDEKLGEILVHIEKGARCGSINIGAAMGDLDGGIELGLHYPGDYPSGGSVRA